MPGIAKPEFKLLAGQEALKHFTKSENTVLSFCSNCGSSLYAEKPKRGMLHLRLGVLNEAPTISPQFHSYVGSKAAWDNICDNLPQYEAGRS